jgi:hypothetical protein
MMGGAFLSRVSEECSLHSPPPYKPIDTVQGIIREVRVQKSVSRVGLACRAATFFEVMNSMSGLPPVSGSAMRRSAAGCITTGSTRPHDRAPEEKLRLLVEALNLDDEALWAFLRREGIHKAHLEQWQRDVLNVLSTEPS